MDIYVIVIISRDNKVKKAHQGLETRLSLEPFLSSLDAMMVVVMRWQR